MTRAGLQCAQMLCALGLGLSLGVIYDLYRIFIKKGHGKAWCRLGDLLWWIVALGWTFLLLVRISWAEMRIPIVVAVFLGIAVYLYYFSPVLSQVYKKSAAVLKSIFKRLLNIVVKVISLLFAPAVFLSGLLYKIIFRLYRTVAGIFLGFYRLLRKLFGKGRQKRQLRLAEKKRRREDGESAEKANQKKSKRRKKPKKKQKTTKNNKIKKRKTGKNLIEKQ